MVQNKQKLIHTYQKKKNGNMLLYLDELGVKLAKCLLENQRKRKTEIKILNIREKWF